MNEDTKKLIVRRATETDLDSIVKLHRELTEYHVKLDEVYKFKENIEEISRRYYSSSITSEDKMLLVAEIDGEIVGFTLGKIEKTPPFYQIEEFGHLLGTFVREQYRRKRIGEKMTYELLEWFKSKGLKRVELSVDIRNKIGVSAWTKFGFEPIHYQMRKNL